MNHRILMLENWTTEIFSLTSHLAHEKTLLEMWTAKAPHSLVRWWWSREQDPAPTPFSVWSVIFWVENIMILLCTVLTRWQLTRWQWVTSELISFAIFSFLLEMVRGLYWLMRSCRLVGSWPCCMPSLASPWEPPGRAPRPLGMSCTVMLCLQSSMQLLEFVLKSSATQCSLLRGRLEKNVGRLLLWETSIAKKANRLHLSIKNFFFFAWMHRTFTCSKQ